MSVTIKTGNLKYKNSNGQYVGIGAVGLGNIEEAVDDWLGENITNPDSPPLDRSLSSSSSAAPADMVGDLKSALQFTAQSINLLTNATVHTGYKINPDGELEAVSTYTTYEIACDGSFDKFSAEVYSNTNYNIRAISFINSGGTAISVLEFPSTSGNSTFTDQAIPSGAVKFYLSNKSSAYSTPSASASIEKSQRLDDIEDAIDDIHQIPSGGTQGQVLAKSSGTDYAVQWVDQSEGGEIDDTAGIGDTDKTWSANKIELLIDPINEELNFQSTTRNLLSEATLYTGYKLDENGDKASASNNDVYEVLYDGTYDTFTATVFSNSNYQMKAISFQNAQGTVLSTLEFPSTSVASTFTNQTIPSGTAKILLNNKRSAFTDVVWTCPSEYSKRFSDIESAIAANTKVRNALPLSTKNLYDVSKATNNCMIVTGNGNTADYDGHIVSDYIPVSAKTIYTISAKLAKKYTFATTGLRYVFYNSSKTYISGFGDAPPTTFRTPANAAYIRFSLYNTLVDVQLERRHFATKYAPYNSYVVDDESDSMFLSYPAKMYAVTGLQYNFYMFNVTPERHIGQFEWNFGRNNTKMHNYGRFMRIESNNSSTSDIKCSADVRSRTKWAWKEFVTKVKNPANLQNVSVLILGDSTTANGYVAADLHTYSGNESKITTLGTKGTAPNNHEGRSGWTLNLYFTEDEDNPFYNPTTETFDAQYYFTNTGVSVPDIFIINLGINDMHYTSDNLYDAKATADSYIEKVNAVITSLRLVSATMKIAICLTIPPNVDPYGFGAAGTNIMNYDQYRIANLVLCEKLIDEYDYRESEYLYLIPINSVLDTKYNMPSETSTPNSRSNTQITVPNTAGNVHPNEGGYYQIADEIYAFICSLYVT